MPDLLLVCHLHSTKLCSLVTEASVQTTWPVTRDVVSVLNVSVSRRSRDVFWNVLSQSWRLTVSVLWLNVLWTSLPVTALSWLDGNQTRDHKADVLTITAIGYIHHSLLEEARYKLFKFIQTTLCASDHCHICFLLRLPAATWRDYEWCWRLMILTYASSSVFLVHRQHRNVATNQAVLIYVCLADNGTDTPVHIQRLNNY